MIHIGKQKTRPANIAAAEKRARAVAMRKQGLTYDAISAALAVCKSRAVQLVFESLDEINAGRRDEHQELIAHDWALTTALLDACLPAALDGNLKACDRVIKILERRAKLKGLDALTRIDLGEKPLQTYNREEMRTMLIEGLRKQGRLIEATEAPTGDKTNGTNIAE